GVVAHEGEIAVAAVDTRRHELPVGLENERISQVAAAPGSDRSTRVEAPIDAAVGVVADEGEGPAAAIGRVTRRHELPVGLENERIDVVVAPTRGGNFPARAERWVEIAWGGARSASGCQQHHGSDQCDDNTASHLTFQHSVLAPRAGAVGFRSFRTPGRTRGTKCPGGFGVHDRGESTPPSPSIDLDAVGPESE